MRPEAAAGAEKVLLGLPGEHKRQWRAAEHDLDHKLEGRAILPADIRGSFIHFSYYRSPRTVLMSS